MKFLFISGVTIQSYHARVPEERIGIGIVIEAIVVIERAKIVEEKEIEKVKDELDRQVLIAITKEKTDRGLIVDQIVVLYLDQDHDHVKDDRDHEETHQQPGNVAIPKTFVVNANWRKNLRIAVVLSEKLVKRNDHIRKD